VTANKPHLPREIFVEEITYTETNRYVGASPDLHEKIRGQLQR
jgi:hypothetical protein